LYVSTREAFFLALSGSIETLPFFLDEEYAKHGKGELEVQEQP
jgi:hypothetical protein